MSDMDQWTFPIKGELSGVVEFSTMVTGAPFRQFHTNLEIKTLKTLHPVYEDLKGVLNNVTRAITLRHVFAIDGLIRKETGFSIESEGLTGKYYPSEAMVHAAHPLQSLKMNTPHGSFIIDMNNPENRLSLNGVEVVVKPVSESGNAGEYCYVKIDETSLWINRRGLFVGVISPKLKTPWFEKHRLG